MKTNILGTEYEIILNAKKEEYPILNNYDGYTDTSIKQIVVAKFNKEITSLADLDYYSKKVLRHELIHAFMYESGLSVNSVFGDNEELIDWLAIQFPKLLNVFDKVNAIEK